MSATEPLRQANQNTDKADKPDRTVVVMTKAMPEPKQLAPRSAFVPLLLALLALLASFGWQTAGLVGDRTALQAAHAGQQQTVDNAGKLRGSLDALATDTQRLAEAGNGSAALLVAELKKRGITINPNAAGAAAAAAAPATPTAAPR